MKTIAVVGGGNSSEYTVSIKSAVEVMKTLESRYYTFLIIIKGDEWYWEDPNGRAISVNKNSFTLQLHDRIVKFDAVFISIHGTPGEDGLLQGYFDMIGLPYSSCSAFCSALTFNKQATKAWLKEYCIPMAKSVLLRRDEKVDQVKILGITGLPCFVKPNDSGSSYGVSMVSEPQDLKKAIEIAFNESNEVLIETMMQGTEVSCGVVKTKGFEMVLPVTEIRSKNAFFDYEAKYSPGVSDEITPAQIPTDVYDKVQKMSSGIYDLLGCSGIVRVDFIIVNNLPMFLEINTVPGMTAESILPKQIAASGMEAADLYSKIIEDLF